MSDRDNYKRGTDYQPPPASKVEIDVPQAYVNYPLMSDRRAEIEARLSDAPRCPECNGGWGTVVATGERVPHCDQYCSLQGQGRVAVDDVFRNQLIAAARQAIADSDDTGGDEHDYAIAVVDVVVPMIEQHVRQQVDELHETLAGIMSQMMTARVLLVQMSGIGTP